MKILCIIPTMRKRGENLYVKKLRQMGHDIFLFDHREYTNKFKYMGYNLPILYRHAVEKTNKKLKQVSKKFKPDLLFSIKAETIHPKTILWIRKTFKIPTMVWFVDDPFYFNKLSKKIAPAYDYVFTNSPKSISWYKKIGVENINVLMFACDPEVQKTLKISKNEKKEYGSDVTFVGNSYPRRIVALSNLTDFNLKIWGPNWSRNMISLKLIKRGKIKSLISVLKSGLFEKCTYRFASAEEMVKIYNASKLTIDAPKSLNIRLFEVISSGCLLITSKAEKSLEDYFEIGKEIICFEGIKDMREKVKYYLDNPKEREMIAKRGQRRAHKDHTTEKRMKQVLSTIE